MLKAIKSLGQVINGLDTKFDNACLSLERKVCGGNTVDQQLDKFDGKVIDISKSAGQLVVLKGKAVQTTSTAFFKKTSPVVKESVTKVKESTTRVKEVVSSAVITPFTKCTDKFNPKPVVKKELPKVEAIPLTQYCPFCRTNMPIGAHFCPECSEQIIVPMAKCGPKPATACKIKGIAPAIIHTPVKQSLVSKIKSALNTEVSKLNTPFAKINPSLIER